MSHESITSVIIIIATVLQLWSEYSVQKSYTSDSGYVLVIFANITNHNMNPSTDRSRISTKRKLPPVMQTNGNPTKKRRIDPSTRNNKKQQIGLQSNNNTNNNNNQLNDNRGGSVSSMNTSTSSWNPSRSNSLSLTPDSSITNVTMTPYSREKELIRCSEQIAKIDSYMYQIKHSSHKCIDYNECISRLSEQNNIKLRSMENELNSTRQYVNNKYFCSIKMINNYYNDKILNITKQLLTKYKLKKNKEERLLKNELLKSRKKKENQRKKLLKKQKLLKNKNDSIHLNNNYNICKPSYCRYKLWNSNEINQNQSKFSDNSMQIAWNLISGIDNKQMENDVNQMVKNQDAAMNIIDILSLFPAKKVVYKLDKNVLQIGDLGSKDSLNIKIGSFIIVKYLKQATMIGVVKSISNKKLCAIMRKKGDKTIQNSLIEITIQTIEEGKVKIKIIH